MWAILAAALLGAGAGVLSGLFGVGGGILFVPKNWQPLEPTKKLEWNTLVPSEIAISVSIRAGQDPRTENDD